MKNQFYRTCRITQDDNEYDAIFHRFDRDAGLVMQTDIDGNNHSAVVTRLVGVVERKDGQIVIVEPEQIKFLDGFSARIIKRFFDKEAFRNEQDED